MWLLAVTTSTCHLRRWPFCSRSVTPAVRDSCTVPSPAHFSVFVTLGTASSSTQALLNLPLYCARTRIRHILALGRAILDAKTGCQRATATTGVRASAKSPLLTSVSRLFWSDVNHFSNRGVPSCALPSFATQAVMATLDTQTATTAKSAPASDALTARATHSFCLQQFPHVVAGVPSGIPCTGRARAMEEIAESLSTVDIR